MAQMMIKVLPEIAGKIAEPLSQIDKITIIGGGSEDNGIGSVAGNVPVVMAKLFEAKWVVSRAERDVQEKFLLRNGADQVVYPEKQMAKWTAIRYSSDHVFDYIEIDSQYAIFEVEIPENWIGKNVGQLDIRKKYGINILATRKYGKTDVAVSPETVLNGDATILVLGEYKAIQKCFRI